MMRQYSIPFPERLLASSTHTEKRHPFITIAIPHYKYAQYLEVVLASIFEQEFEDYEIVVSDDCSPDESNVVIPPILSNSGKAFRYYAQQTNLGYDGNVRFCLAASFGRYVMLLGNDDALGDKFTLRDIASHIEVTGFPQVAFTNFADYMTGEVTTRAQQTSCLGSGPTVAIRFYRSFSFVSGLIYEQQATREHETDRWDQSVFYQIYLASRIIATGAKVASLAICAVRKDVRLNEKTVSNYTTKWAENDPSFQPHLGLRSVIRVTADAILPNVSQPARSKALRKIVSQMYFITYPFWLLEYRRVATWRYSTRIARGMWPGTILTEYNELKSQDRLILSLLYGVTTIAGLLFPGTLFHKFSNGLANQLRHRQQKE